MEEQKTLREKFNQRKIDFIDAALNEIAIKLPSEITLEKLEGGLADQHVVLALPKWQITWDEARNTDGFLALRKACEKADYCLGFPGGDPLQGRQPFVHLAIYTNQPYAVSPEAKLDKEQARQEAKQAKAQQRRGKRFGRWTSGPGAHEGA